MSVLNLTKDNFEKEVIESDIPVLVDFWAPWCVPCRMLSPIVDEVAEEADGLGVKFCKLNVDDEGELAEKYGIYSIPALFLFKDGKVETESVGLVSKERIYEIIGK